MVAGKLKNLAQCCCSRFDIRLFRCKFLVKVVSIAFLSFTPNHFHNSCPTLLDEIYFLVPYMTQHYQRLTWTWIWI